MASFVAPLGGKSFPEKTHTDLSDEQEKLRQFLPELIQIAEKKVPYAHILFTSADGLRVARNKSQESITPVSSMTAFTEVYDPQTGVAITVYDGRTFHTVATNRLTKDHLVKATKTLCDSVKVQNGPEIDVGQEKTERHFADKYEIDPETVPIEERRTLCKEGLEKLLSIDPRIVNGIVRIETISSTRMFANKAKLLSQTRRMVSFRAQAIARSGMKQALDYESLLGTGYEITKVEDDFYAGVVSEALGSLDADKIEPGKYRVLLDPVMAGLLGHESFGHGCEIDALERGGAKSAEYIERRVGSDLVSIADFGGIPGVHGTIAFSDDGVLTTGPTYLIKDGILQPTLLTDLSTFLRIRNRIPGLKLSANGRCESFDHPVYPRMTNTYFCAREDGLEYEAMLEKVGDGILLQSFLNGMEDPNAWGIQLESLKGKEIKGGKLTGRRFYQVGATGYVPDVLGSVFAVGRRLVIHGGGSCGKGHKEIVPVDAGGPYIGCVLELG